MAETNQPKETFSNERAELLKSNLLNSKSFTNPDNQKFARVQSTPLEEQQKKAGGGGFLKARLAAKQALKAAAGGVGFEFNPTAETGSVTESFLKITPQEFIPAAPQNGTHTTLPSNITPTVNKEVTGTLSSTSQSFQLPVTQPSVSDTSSKASVSTTGTTEKKGSLKSKLKLSSASFPVPVGGTTGGVADTSAPFIPSGQAITTIGKPAGKATAEEKKVDKTSSPSKLSLKTDLVQKDKKPLESIPEKKEEIKEVAPKVQEKPVEQPVIENKKQEYIPTPSNEFKEVKPKGKKTDTKPAPTRKYDIQPQQISKPVVTTKEEQKPVEEVQPKVETKPEPEKKVEEKQLSSPAKKEVRIEIVVTSRKEFADEVAKLSETLKDRPLPEGLEKYIGRNIILETQRGKPSGKQQTGGQGGFDRQQPKKEVIVDKAAEDGFSRRTTAMKEATPEQPKIVRLGLTPEELEMKEKLSKSVNAWIAGKKGETDPEEATRKEIKFNLNIITLDNFDVIKEKILEIASQNIDNCKKVSEFIIENAWTQKQYVNTYAKLCDFLGKQDKLNFDEVKEARKKKNDFKLLILKKIQTVFEEESHASLGFKKPVEEMDADERSLYFFKKKQRILGNVSFIGELFLERFIVIGVVRLITNALLSKCLQEYDEYQKAAEKPKNKFYEDTLEGLLKFYEIIGKAVEEKEASRSEGKGKEKEKNQKSSNVVANFQKVVKAINSGTPSESLPKLGDDEASLEQLFKIFDVMLAEGNLSPRLDSLVKNLIYRKENKWQAPLAKNQGPKTMKELHEEYEREQIEAERRAEEFREELRDSYYYAPKNPRNTRTDVVFQVASDNKERKQEEAKFDVGQVNVDTNISFRPQRGKQDAKSADEPKVNFDQIERDLKDIYKLIDGEEIEDKTTPEEETKKLAKRVGGRHVLHIYFKTFHDGRMEQVPKRLFIPNLLIEEKLATEDEFINKFQKALDKMYDIFCDAPNLDKYCAVILLDLCKKKESGEPFNKINFTKEFYDNEESEFILEFYHDFFRAILDYLDKDYADLKDKITEDTLKEFAKKIKYENY